MSFENLQELIIKKKNPTVAGLDPRIEYVPDCIKEEVYKQYGQTLKGAAEAIYQFNCGLIDALKDIVPAVKLQSAYYENIGWQGMEAFQRTVQYARKMGLFVIADVKRGDIGTTATAYAEAWLGETDIEGNAQAIFDADCCTVNGYMGTDAIIPFLNICRQKDKSIFLLVKTSNKSSIELQDLIAGDRLVYQVMGDLCERLADNEYDRYGYSRIGAVTGATYPSDIRKLRERLPHTFFLVPGYGAQGGTAEDVRFAFDRYGHGAVVNSSRGIICAWKKTGSNGEDYQDAARNAAIAMRDDIKQYVTIV